MPEPVSVEYPGATVEWRLWETGAESGLLLNVTQWAMDEKRALEPLDWNLTLALESRPTGLLLRALQCEGFNEDWDLHVWLQCIITIDGQTPLASPKLVVLDSDWNLDPDQFLIAVSGKCQMEALLAEDQSMSPIRSVSGATVSAYGAIEEILEEFGITAFEFHFDDYGLPELNRVGSPIGWLREILAPVCGWCRWEDGVLHFYPGGLNVEAADAAHALGDHDSKFFNLRYSSSDAKNRAVVERTGQAIAGLNEPAKGFVTYGESYVVKVTLDNPVTYGTAAVDVGAWGRVESYIWFDEADDVLTSSSEKTYSGDGTPAFAVQFTIVPNSGFTGDIAWELQVPGTVWNPDLGPYDADYSATYTATSDAEKCGVRAYPQPFVLKCCPDQGMAAEAAERIVWEGLRFRMTANASAVLHSEFRSGNVVGMTCEIYDFTAKKFLIESMNRAGDVDSLTMALSLVRTAV